MDRVIWYKTGTKLVCVVPLKKKSSILSVSETSLGILSCAITRSLGYNGHKEVPFSSWTVKLPVICNHCVLPIVCRITSKNYLDDLRWHHYCISFSGERGVFSQYQDGIKTKTETGVALGYDGGGTLKLGKRTGHEFKFTGFNLWDRVLPPEEIKQMANSFTKGTGTVKNWFDFADAPKSISSMEVLSPSQYIAPPQSEKAESPTSPPARDNTKESLSIDTMSRNLDWMLDLEYYSVCLLYSSFTQGLRKSHTISHSSYL